MKIITKVILLSALVFPGAGHVYLKKYLSGSVLIVFSFISICYLIGKTTEYTLEVVEKIQHGDIPLDILAITEPVSQLSTGTDNQLFDIATSVFIVCWIIGVIDSYRIAYKKDKTLKVFNNN